MTTVRIIIEEEAPRPWTTNQILVVKINRTEAELTNGTKQFVGFSKDTLGEFFEVTGVNLDVEGNIFRVALIDTEDLWPGLVWIKNPK